jgi:hypothetical protein
MSILEFLGGTGRSSPTTGRPLKSRPGQTIAFDVTQNGNEISIHAAGIDIFFAVEGLALPTKTDPSFAVWGLLPLAMEEGFNFHINHPIDPLVAANAEHLSKIWEMWTPHRSYSVKVSGQSGWSRLERTRRPLVQLYSGGIDSTFSILKHRNPEANGVTATVCGVDKTQEENFPSLIAKTEPLLKMLNYDRVLIRTNAQRDPPALTHGFTLASCLFLLSDLFEEGTLAADSTFAEDMATFPWGTNHVTNEYFAGSDFSIRTVGTDVKRTEKIAAIVEAGIDLGWLSFCRSRRVIPDNCGICGKCIRTKAMFLVATGSIPKIFLDNSFDESLLRKMGEKYSHRVHLFDVYHCAQERGMLDKIPGLETLVEECRAQAAANKWDQDA